jgi:multidrug efflux system membrane fusion protein
LPADSNNTPHADLAHRLAAPHSGHSQRPSSRILVWGILLAVFALAFYWILHRHEAQKTTSNRRGAQGGVVPVLTATAQSGNIGVYQEAIGTVTPVYTSSITSQVNGIVIEVRYREGQIVHKGDPLVEIDSRQYSANLLQAQGTLQHDQGVLAQARMDLERYKAAWASNAIPRQQLEDQEKLVQQEEGTVKQDEGAVQFDQVQVDFCHIAAPITGRVGLRLVDPGNVVTSNGGTILAVITQLQPITLIFTVPEDALGQIVPRLNGRGRLNVDAYDRTDQKKINSGTLLTLDNQVDTTTGTVKARAQFDNRDGALYPNEFVNARLLVNTLQNVILVPTSAIQHNGNTAFVYVIANNKAQMRTVKPGITDGDTTQITGITQGEIVANSSFDKLQPNAQVSISRQQASSTSTSGSSTP